VATVYERLKKIIVKQLAVEEEEVTPSASFADDFGADSLDLVELIMALEEEFSSPSQKIEISDEDAEKIVTVQDAIDYGLPPFLVPPTMRESLPLPLIGQQLISAKETLTSAFFVWDDATQSWQKF